jgi:uncharacterized alkaline shock family protein YloU
MKMKAGTRVIMTLYIVFVIILSLFVLMVLAGAYDSSMLIGVANTIASGSFWYKLGYGAIAVVLIIAGVMLLFFGIKKETPKTAKIAAFENGSIVIAVKAIEELVQRFLREASDVKETHSSVTSYSDYINIDVEISVRPGISVPDVTKALQDGLKEDIEKHTGITVKETKIVVASIYESASKLPLAGR